jgi:hypothetical protein
MELLVKEIKAGQEENRINQEKMEADRKADKQDLLAKMDANQAKAEADRKTNKEEIKTGHKELLAKMGADSKASQVKADADREQMQEFMKMLEAYQAKTDAVLPAMQETATAFEPEIEVNTMACQGMEAHQEEEKPASLDTKPEAAQRKEVPVEDAEVIQVGELKKKRRRDRKLAAQHRREKTNTSTRDNCGPQKRLDVARRGTSHRATVARKMQADQRMPSRATLARRMRHIVKKNLTQGARGFPRKRLVMADKKITRCVSMAENKSLRPQGDQSDPRKSLHKDVLEKAREELGSRKAIRLEPAKRTLGTSSRLQETMNWTLWRCQGPPKRKKGNDPHGRTRCWKYRSP